MTASCLPPSQKNCAQGLVLGCGGKVKVISLKEPGEFELAVVYFFVSSRHGTVMRRAARSMRQRAVDFNAPATARIAMTRPLAISWIDVAVATGGSGLQLLLL